MLMFSTEVYLRLLERYNEAVWPAQLIAAAVGVLALYLVLDPRRGTDRFVIAVLAASQWVGAFHHIAFFATVNWAAWAFGAAFALQGLLVAWSGGAPRPLAFRVRPDLFGWAGLGLAILALAGYPLAGWLAGHGWPQAALFGVAPVPTVAFLLGLLLLAEPRVPRRLLVVPGLWCLVWAPAAWMLALPEDAALSLAGLGAVVLALAKNRVARSGGSAG